MRCLALLFVFFMLAAPEARAACLKLDCSQDPDAWGDMLGDTPEAQAEQQTARSAAGAYVSQRDEAKYHQMVATFGVKERFQMLYTLEDTFSRLVGRPYTVISAVVLPRGDGYLFCGSGYYGAAEGQGGVFAFDTNEGGVRTLSAQKTEFAAAGCNGPLAMTLR
jgi:hypothetical protein